MIILGIDPGSRTAGYAIIKVEGKKVTYIDSGIMRYDHIKEFNERPGIIFSSCVNLMERYIPDEVSFESLVYVKNPSSLIKLAQARGAMLAAIGSKMEKTFFEYSPNLVKSSVTGHGHASKNGIQKSLDMIFGKRSYKTHDESDALAIALCHALNRKVVTRERRL